MGKKEKVHKTEFELLKQVLIELGNINYTLATMNAQKLFPSKRVQESIDMFFEDREEFVKSEGGEQ